MTLTEFLLARIAEDEDVARNVLAGDDPLDWTEPGDPAVGLAGPVDGPSGYESIVIDPERVLAECAAKRRIVDRLSGVIGDRPPAGSLDEDGWELLAWETLYDLAAVYADHPGYRDEWRP